MSKKAEDPVAEPQIEEPEDDEGEESDEYDNIEVRFKLTLFRTSHPRRPRHRMCSRTNATFSFPG